MKCYEVVEYKNKYHIQDNYNIDVFTGKPYLYKMNDKHSAVILNSILNKQSYEINKLKELLVDINSTINYIKSNEEDYGDEYTAEVLEDLQEKFGLDKITYYGKYVKCRKYREDEEEEK